MTSTEPLPAAILKRTAVVYVRQSTQSQVMTNLESKRRQYDLVGVARQHGFADVEIIDDDLGRSASGTVARPGFERLVTWLCVGKVGAVLCLDASRLARNRERIARDPVGDNPYRNHIAVKAGHENDPWVKPLVASFQTDAVRAALDKGFKGAAVAAW